MLSSIVELKRVASASPQPHGIATDSHTIWISSRATKQVDVLEHDSLKKLAEIAPPGMPWGMTFGNGAVYMTCGEGEDDTRIVRRYLPGKGFDATAIHCPDDTGSHLAIFDNNILLGQWYNRQLLVLDDTGWVLDSYDAPHGIAGVAVVDGVAHILGTDDEDHGDYWITRLDLRDRTAKPQDVALVPFHARSLAYDGARWWTNHREADQTVCFSLPA